MTQINEDLLDRIKNTKKEDIADLFLELKSSELDAPEICDLLIKKNPKLLQFLLKHQQSESICIAAVKSDSGALRHAKIRTDAIYDAAISFSGHALAWVPAHAQTLDRCKNAIHQVGSSGSSCFPFVINKSEEICLFAIEHNWNNLRYIEKPSEEMCVLAYDKNPLSIRFIWPEMGVMKAEKIEHDSIDPVNQTILAFDVQRKMECSIFNAVNITNRAKSNSSRRQLDVC